MATPFTKGGEQRVVSVLSSLLCELSYDVTILCTDYTPINYSLYNLNPRVHIKFADGYQTPEFGEKRIKRDIKNVIIIHQSYLRTSLMKKNMITLSLYQPSIIPC